MALNLINAKLTQKALLIAHLLRSNIKIINFLGHGAGDGKEAKSSASLRFSIFLFSVRDVPEFQLQNANGRRALIAILLRCPSLTVKMIFTCVCNVRAESSAECRLILWLLIGCDAEVRGTQNPQPECSATSRLPTRGMLHANRYQK
jgi:hypothetical protein